MLAKINFKLLVRSLFWKSKVEVSQFSDYALYYRWCSVYLGLQIYHHYPDGKIHFDLFIKADITITFCRYYNYYNLYGDGKLEMYSDVLSIQVQMSTREFWIRNL